ncbi:MAG: hypothetical protein ACREBJ_11555, partial [Nitrosotalea sp.]
MKSQKLKNAKMLFYDIETTPLLSYNWGIYQQDAIKVKQQWYMLSFSYKWYGEKKTHVKTLADYPNFKKDIKDDYALVKDLHAIMNEADILIAHNGNKFDQKKANARFAFHHLPPVRPTQRVDTL